LWKAEEDLAMKDQKKKKDKSHKKGTDSKKSEQSVKHEKGFMPFCRCYMNTWKSTCEDMLKL